MLAIPLMLLAALRVGPDELGVRTDRWETLMTQPVIEAILERPLTGPEMFRRWDERLSPAEKPDALLRFSAELLGGTDKSPPGARPPP